MSSRFQSEGEAQMHCHAKRSRENNRTVFVVSVVQNYTTRQANFFIIFCLELHTAGLLTLFTPSHGIDSELRSQSVCRAPVDLHRKKRYVLLSCKHFDALYI